MANPKHRHALRAIKGNVTFRPLPNGSLRCNQTKVVLPNGEQDAYRRSLLNGMRADVPIFGNDSTLRRSTLSAKPTMLKTVMVKTDTSDDGTPRHRFTCRHCNRVNLLKPKAANKIQRSRVRSASCRFCDTYNPLSFRSRRATRTDTPNKAPLSKRPRNIAKVCKYGDNGASEFGFTCCVCGQENRIDPTIVEKLDKKRPKRKCLKCQRVNKLEFGQRRRKRRAYGQT